MYDCCFNFDVIGVVLLVVLLFLFFSENCNKCFMLEESFDELGFVFCCIKEIGFIVYFLLEIVIIVGGLSIGYSL